MMYSEDAEANPVSHYALLNLLLSIQILEKYVKNDPNAVSLMKSLSKKYLEIISICNLRFFLATLDGLFATRLFL